MKKQDQPKAPARIARRSSGIRVRRKAEHHAAQLERERANRERREALIASLEHEATIDPAARRKLARLRGERPLLTVALLSQMQRDAAARVSTLNLHRDRPVLNLIHA